MLLKKVDMELIKIIIEKPESSIIEICRRGNWSCKYLMGGLHSTFPAGTPGLIFVLNKYIVQSIEARLQAEEAGWPPIKRLSFKVKKSQKRYRRPTGEHPTGAVAFQPGSNLHDSWWYPRQLKISKTAVVLKDVWYSYLQDDRWLPKQLAISKTVGDLQDRRRSLR
jgi:hypothetical protein